MRATLGSLNMPRWFFLLLLVVAIFAGGGCGDDDDSSDDDDDDVVDDDDDDDDNDDDDDDDDNDDDDNDDDDTCDEELYPVCCPGEERDCLCFGEITGTQTCKDDGLWWDPCHCYESCTTVDDCYDYQACTGRGTCGECTTNQQCRAGRKCQEGYCVLETLPIWELTLTPEGLAYIIANPGEFAPCQLTAEGENFDSGCEIRLRGNLSLEFPKKSFRIQYPDGNSSPGYTKKINLRAEYNDPSFLRTHLGYEAFGRMGFGPAPKSRFLRLYLNGEYYGLFNEVEQIGGDFLERRDRSENKSMYEADPPVLYYINGGTTFLPMPSELDYRSAYVKTKGDEEDYSDLIAFIEQAIWPDYLDGHENFDLNTFRIRNHLDWDLYIDYLAIMGIIQSHDNVKENFYFSRQDFGKTENRWEFYPWDLDMSFGCLWDDENANNICDDLITDGAYNRGIHPLGETSGYPDHHFFSLLIHQVLLDTELSEYFKDRICKMVDSDYWTTELPNYILAMETSIRSAAVEDTNDLNETENDFETAVDELLTFVDERQTFLINELGCTK